MLGAHLIKRVSMGNISISVCFDSPDFYGYFERLIEKYREKSNNNNNIKRIKRLIVEWTNKINSHTNEKMMSIDRFHSKASDKVLHIYECD